MPTDTIYSLSDLNLMGRVLTEEFGGTWRISEDSDGDHLFFATLGTDIGDITYSSDSQYWWVIPRTTTDHEEIVRRFFEAVGIEAGEASRYAGRIVSARSTSSVENCIGPRRLDIFTIFSGGEWVTFFIPLFSADYDANLSPC